ncbi:hypothetical protein KIPE111705_04260 [Kibdelosporangium persicum]|uniref:Uncharacterized protein n=1 Tax=Kibdelosporangium persicum TaxID=2698649 RepID=A0ABX2F5B0_9PSEU|nr:hypothetical protein [Kibdelosporangium persicum]NRN66529.1 hypothetical protein [Kibdelosporangium persicum]
MSVVVLVLFLAAVAAAIGLLVAMSVKDKPLYGGIAVGILTGPGTVLAFLYMAAS